MLVVLAGWTGLLTASLVRSAAAACSSCAPCRPCWSRSSRWPSGGRTGLARPGAGESLPFQYGLDAVRGADLPSASALLDPVLLAAVLAPFGLLLLAGVLAQARRRTL